MFKGSLRAMLYVQNVQRSVQFYSDKLGFAVEASYGPDYAIVKAAGEGLGLHAADAASPSKGRVILYHEVKNVDTYYQQLVRRGLKATAPKDEPWGERLFYVDDPDGHQWGFYSPLSLPKMTTKPKPKPKAKAKRAVAAKPVKKAKAKKANR